MFLKMTGPPDPQGKGGDGPQGTSQESSEEFTDAKHESLFSLETNFLEEESGGTCSLNASQGQSTVCVVPFHQVLSMEACGLIHPVKSLVTGMSSNKNGLAAPSRAGKKYFPKVFCGFQWLGSVENQEAI